MSDMNSFNNPPELQAQQPVNRKNSGSGRKKIIISAVILLFVITGIAGLGFAKGFYDNHRGHGHGPLGFMLEKVAKDLDLNSQQKAEVDKIKDEIKAKMESDKPDRKSDMEEMEKMFRSDNFDKQKALEIMKKHDARRDEMRSFMLDEMVKFHSLLTTEQRNKAADMMKDFHMKKRDMRDGKMRDRKMRDMWDKEDGKQ